MTITQPLRLLLLFVPLGFGIAYLVMQFLRPKYAVRFSTTDLLASIAPKRPGWRRHLAAIATLLALVLFVIAFARPAQERTVPRERSTVILAVDVSISMQATDVDPSRIAAVKAAAASFARTAPANVQIGLVHFAGSATVAVAPTFDRAPLERAINNLELASGTAIGEAIYASLDALRTAEVIGKEPASNKDSSQAPARIVLMSDGSTNSGRPNDDAAAAANDAGIPITTIAFGTNEGTIVNPTNGSEVRVPVDGAALEAIAGETGGKYFEAASSSALKTIYQNIGRQIGVEVKRLDMSSWFVGFGLLFAFLAGLFSLIWFQRLP
ncbi:MAG: VWA domain-containing protein [Acidimicrobiia bacterium]